MLTWSDLQALYIENTGDVTKENINFGKRGMNRGMHKLIRAGNLDFPELRLDITTVAAQETYPLPPQYGKVRQISYVDVAGDSKRDLIEVDNQEKWETITSGSPTGHPSHFFVRKAQVGNTSYELHLFPAPSEAAKTIRVTFQRVAPDLSFDNYTTGTITGVMADATITGVGTGFSARMAGKAIILPDGLWYDIASVTGGTALELAYPYQGTTFASAVSFIIGEIPLVPEPHQDAIYSFAVAQYFLKKREKDDASLWLAVYNESAGELKADRSNRSTEQVIYGDDQTVTLEALEAFTYSGG